MFLSRYVTFLITSCSHNFEDHVQSIFYTVLRYPAFSGFAAVISSTSALSPWWTFLNHSSSFFLFLERRRTFQKG